MPAHTYPRLKERKILLVDDNPGFLHFLEIQMKSQGMIVEAAMSMESARTLLNQSDGYDLALIDMYIPEIDGERDRIQRGEELCYEIRHKFYDTHIIGMSNNLQGQPRTPMPNLFAGFIHKDDVEENTAPVIIWETIDSLLQEKGAKQPNIFIVHGHDDRLLLELKDHLQNKLGFKEPIVLRETPDQGKTIIEKFEQQARKADLVFVCLTPDDQVILANDKEIRRARPNVLFELGFFYAKFQRKRGCVILLSRDEVEIPTDLSGIIWIDVSNGLPAQSERLRNELKAIGFVPLK